MGRPHNRLQMFCRNENSSYPCRESNIGYTGSGKIKYMLSVQWPERKIYLDNTQEKKKNSPKPNLVQIRGVVWTTKKRKRQRSPEIPATCRDCVFALLDSAVMVPFRYDWRFRRSAPVPDEKRGRALKHDPRCFLLCLTLHHPMTLPDAKIAHFRVNKYHYIKEG